MRPRVVSDSYTIKGTSFEDSILNESIFICSAQSFKIDIIMFPHSHNLALIVHDKPKFFIFSCEINKAIKNNIILILDNTW